MTANVRHSKVEAVLVARNGEPGPLDEPGFHFTRTGLDIDPGVTFDQWEKFGRKLQLADIGIQWALGDWLIHGENHWPDKYEQAVLATGYREGTLMNYAFVARAIPNSRRRESVDYSTHVEVASLPADEADRILARAAGNPDIGRDTVRKEAQRVKRKLKLTPSELEVIHTPDVKDFLETYIQILKDQEMDLPKSAPFLRNMVHAHIGQAQWQLDRTVESDCEVIMEAVEELLGPQDDIAHWLQARGYFMRDPELTERIDYMCEQKMIKPEKQGGKKDTQRGDMVTNYLPYYARTGDAYNAHRANSIYSQGEQE